MAERVGIGTRSRMSSVSSPARTQLTNQCLIVLFQTKMPINFQSRQNSNKRVTDLSSIVITNVGLE